MGCEQSISGPTSLTSHQVELIKSTWYSISDRKLELGVQIYHSLLDNGGALRKLFPRLVMSKRDGGVGEEKMEVDEQALTKHALLVMDGLDVAVSYLDKPESLRHFLCVLGCRHSQAGVPSQCILQLWPFMHQGFRAVLGADYTWAAQRAWKGFFTHMCYIMVSAMAEQTASSKNSGHVTNAKSRGAEQFAR